MRRSAPFRPQALRRHLSTLLLASSIASAQPAVAPPPHAFNPYARGERALDAYLRNVKLDLYSQAGRVVLEVK